MSYYWEAFEDYFIINKSIIDDGEGGFNTSWEDGATIQASFDMGDADEQRQAEAQKLKIVGTMTFPKGTPIEYGSYLRNSRTRKIYRITSDPKDNETPKNARFQSCFATAERTELPQ